uniref:helix-turn-helix domain-containing protein n=1 Tax=Actinomyces oricola TaxID=206043 RepID=UPI0019D49987
HTAARTTAQRKMPTNKGEHASFAGTPPGHAPHSAGSYKDAVVRFRTLDTNNWDALLIFLEKLRSQDVSCETQIAKISQIKGFNDGITSSVALNQPAINGLDSNTPPVDGIPVTQIQHPRLRPVTDQQRQQVIELYRAGSSIVEIVERSGVSRSSIHRICRKEGLLRRPRGLSQQHR